MTRSCRLLLCFALLAGLALASSCGRNGLDPSPVGNGTGGTTSGPTGTGGASGTCSEAPCLIPLFTDCAPEGSCTSQSSGIGTQSDCYANGVKQQTVTKLGTSGVTATVTVEHDGAICYSVDATGSTSGSGLALVIRNASGKQVATGTGDLTSAAVTVTCSGGQAVSLGQECGSMVAGLGSCSPGVCAF